ncbi:MAG: anti-sigma factor [Saprospiraceae bacterium]|nr:anti-sigma factor [Saprospiraceae bacterium]
MNIGEYIASGILESYVLGQLSSSEMKAVEDMAAKYPAVKQELIAIESGLEAFAMNMQVKPPAHLKNKIKAELFSQASPSFKSDSKPEIKISPDTTASPDTSIIRQLKFYKLAFAASVALLIGSAVLNVILATQSSEIDDSNKELMVQNKEMIDELSAEREKSVALNEIWNNVSEPGMQSLTLDGQAIDPTASARVYWNSSSGQVFIYPVNLKTPPAGHQYQLWAIVDGVPVDAGVFDVASGIAGIQRMKSFNAASAFAVTLEVEGGSPTPTLEQMYVMGAVKDI